MRRFHGYYNSPLTENGREQVRLLGERFRDIEVDIIYSSDLRRAHHTALGISRAKNDMPVIKRKALREINGGKWEDVPWDDLTTLFSEHYETWLNSPHKLQMPEGENMWEFQARLLAEVDGICTENNGKNICVVTHGTAIKVLLCEYLGVGLEGFNQVCWCDNASITVVEIRDGKYNVTVEGDNSHLGDTGTIEKQNWWKNTEGGQDIC